LKVEREGQEKGFNAENPEDTEDAEKRKAAEGSLHSAARAPKCGAKEKIGSRLAESG